MAAVFTLAPAVVLSLALGAQTQKAAAPYPQMAPIDQYLMADRDAEIAFAKTTAPKAISDNAEVMTLERQGYVTAVQGTNGFVCMVERSWTAGIEDPDFWNAKLRAPICFNPPGARSYLPITLARTRLVLAGKSKAQMFDAIAAALDKKELPALEAGAMCYMMSKEGYLGDQFGRWHPHLMFFVPLADSKMWGAGLAGSPILAAPDAEDRMTVFLIPVGKWSDGTADHDGY